MARLYNSLPDIAAASTVLRETNSLPDLSQLILKYGLQDRVGVALLHKHFDLVNDTEQVVDLRGSRKKIVVASVFRNGAPDPQVVAEHDLEVPTSPTIVPAMFIVGGSGLIPYEYSCVSEVEAKDLTTTFENLDPEFLSEWRNTLALHQVDGKFGLAMLGDEREVGYEHSNRSQRVNITRESMEGEEDGEDVQYTPAVWYAAKDESDSPMAVMLAGCMCWDGEDDDIE